MLGITLFAGAIYFLLDQQLNIGIPSLIVAIVFSKYTTGYYFWGVEDFLGSESDSDSSSDSGGGGDGGGD